MNFLQAIILGAIEGVAEFLPISSTGHLILASNLLQIQQSEFVKSFEIIVQSGAILAVIVLYWKKIFSNIELGKRVIAAFIPTAIIGFILYKFIKHYLLGNVDVVLVSLLVGGIALIGVELLMARGKWRVANGENSKSNSKLPAISYKQSAIIGLFQSIAVIPGVSRSASSIVGAMLLGLDRVSATEFSFLLAVPTMLAATALDLKSVGFSFSGNEWLVLATGFISSFIVALISIKWLLNYVKTNTYIPFGIYRIALAILYFFLIVK